MADDSLTVGHKSITRPYISGAKAPNYDVAQDGAVGMGSKNDRREDLLSDILYPDTRGLLSGSVLRLTHTVCVLAGSPFASWPWYLLVLLYLTRSTVS